MEKGLVISRKVDEQIEIFCGGKRLLLTVIAFEKNSKVKLHLSADKSEFYIRRAELEDSPVTKKE